MMRQEVTFDDYVADGDFPAPMFIMAWSLRPPGLSPNEAYGTILQHDLVKKYGIWRKPTPKSLKAV